MPNSSRPSRRRLAAVVLLGGLLFAVPIGASAVTQRFLDVPPENTFFNDIEAIAAKGVTTGCGGGNYCPKDFVTREQMAAFMNRLGALGAGKTPVVDAASIQGFGPRDMVRLASATSNTGVDGDLLTGSSLHVTMKVPAPGFVTVQGSAEMSYEGTTGTDDLNCGILRDGGLFNNSTRFVTMDATHDREICSTVFTFEACLVDTLDLAFSYGGAGIDANIGRVSMTAMYVMGDGSGSGPACL